MGLISVLMVALCAVDLGQSIWPCITSSASLKRMNDKLKCSTKELKFSTAVLAGIIFLKIKLEFLYTRPTYSNLLYTLSLPTTLNLLFLCVSQTCLAPESTWVGNRWLAFSWQTPTGRYGFLWVELSFSASCESLLNPKRTVVSFIGQSLAPCDQNHSVLYSMVSVRGLKWECRSWEQSIGENGSKQPS